MVVVAVAVAETVNDQCLQFDNIVLATVLFELIAFATLLLLSSFLFVRSEPGKVIDKAESHEDSYSHNNDTGRCPLGGHLESIRRCGCGSCGMVETEGTKRILKPWETGRTCDNEGRSDNMTGSKDAWSGWGC